jgi:hypothetical protein
MRFSSAFAPKPTLFCEPNAHFGEEDASEAAADRHTRAVTNLIQIKVERAGKYHC